EGWKEHVREVDHELGVESKQEEEENTPKQGRRRIGRGEELGKFLGQRIVTRIPRPHPDDLADPGKDRHAEHETRKEEVLLRDDPDQIPTAQDTGKDVAILRRRARWRLLRPG